MTDMEIMARAREYLDLANTLMGQIMAHNAVKHAMPALSTTKENMAGSQMPSGKDGRREFTLSAEEIKSYQYSDYPIVVTEITRRLNLCADLAQVKELKLTAICNWLVEKGLLMYVKNPDGTNSRMPTAFGEKQGLRVDDHVDKTGRSYRRVLYSGQAQKLIVQNINAIVAFAAECKNKYKKNERVA